MNDIVTYVNFNDLVVLSDTLDFSDDNHLNRFGVAKFNNSMIELLDSLAIRSNGKVIWNLPPKSTTTVPGRD